MVSQETLESRLFYLNRLPPVLEENQRHLERYKKFILSRKEKIFKTKCGLNRHHILPKKMGGVDNKENLIVLTYREHFIAHLILFYCKYKPMCFAFIRMCNTKDGQNFINSIQYEAVRNEHSKNICGKDNPIFKLKNKKEWQWRNAEAQKGKIPWNKGKKMSKDYCDAVKKGHCHLKGEDSPRYGMKMTEASKQRMRNAKKLNPPTGKNNGNYGKKHPGLNHRGKNPSAKKVFCVELGVEFPCIKDAALTMYKDFTLVQGRNYINKSIKEKISVKGYTWELTL
ncbi:MAG: HNH endonuclease signature motif containing protein [Vulcanibacillus sp.]